MVRERLLLIDVGNTNIKIVVANDGVIEDSFVLPTNHQETEDTFGLKIGELCSHLGISSSWVQAWVVSSVVPSLDPFIAAAGEKYAKCPVYIVPRDLPLPLENRYANPAEVGADRLVTAFAARELIETPGIIVVDFGTATTLECVQGRSYLGGLICPGLFSSLRALGGQTAKLPQISLDLRSYVLEIGDSTVTSMNQGFVYGFASMVEGLCAKLRRFLQGEATVVATGGFAAKIQPVCSAIDVVRPDLLHRGLLMAYHHEHGQGQADGSA
jgi:type III pantothenate kinase